MEHGIVKMEGPDQRTNHKTHLQLTHKNPKPNQAKRKWGARPPRAQFGAPPRRTRGRAQTQRWDYFKRARVCREAAAHCARGRARHSVRPAFSPIGGEGARRADEGAAQNNQHAQEQTKPCKKKMGERARPGRSSARPRAEHEDVRRPKGGIVSSAPHVCREGAAHCARGRPRSPFRNTVRARRLLPHWGRRCPQGG
jgi:hypothetical protein